MPGVGISVVAFAVGAILRFAVTVSPYQHGFNINRVGLILMIVGAIGFVLSLLFWGGGRGWYGTRRHQTVVEDDQGNYARREDLYQ
jgi:Trk-type K+ transport system membrane component